MLMQEPKLKNLLQGHRSYYKLTFPLHAMGREANSTTRLIALKKLLNQQDLDGTIEQYVSYLNQDLHAQTNFAA
jgi:hypothetical protein